MSLKQNTLHQGDCVRLLKKLDPGSIDLAFADPPFNIGYEYDVYDDQQSAADYLQWCHEWIAGVYQSLKPDGTFWLAIGDEFAAELKIASQQTGFHCRSWVIWYYTFGVNCVNGFSRSHTHLFHFVKDPQQFTFNRTNPQIRVKSARQLVYADSRANPKGRLPDNTWITRPQDAPESFRANDDIWYFTRVAGTFKEREGFHGCQMPEQLLGRIIRASSHPNDLVLDPFGGSGTTLSVAKKLGRRWMGFELSKDYAKKIRARLKDTQMGEPLVGPEDAIESAPSTARGRKRKQDFPPETIDAIVESFEITSEGYPADVMLCDSDMNRAFVKECRRRKVGGNAHVWNRLLLNLRKSKRLPGSKKRLARIPAERQRQFGYAAEVAWRLVEVEFGVSLDEMFCAPDYADLFDRLAQRYGPADLQVCPTEYRRTAMALRKQAKQARELAAEHKKQWSKLNRPMLTVAELDDAEWEQPGVFLLSSGSLPIYVGLGDNLREQVKRILDNSEWKKLEIDTVQVLGARKQQETGSQATRQQAMQAWWAAESRAMLNSPVWSKGE